MIPFQATEEFALEMDAEDSLRSHREKFHFPKDAQGREMLYFCGNSLGLQPKRARPYIEQELDDWARFGVEGHFHARKPWMPYHEFLTESTARLVGARPIEVVVMNTLTVNLHLMLVSFYRPTRERPKILMEAGAFPSDQYAIASQVRFHGYDPKEVIVEVAPRAGESSIREEDLLQAIRREGSSLALVLLGNVNYLTGQKFSVAAVTEAAHSVGAYAGFDFAHGAGNLKLALHDDGPDFAVWCSYKYLNAGPGALSGCFVHERHARAPELPRFAGWWGQNKQTRFKMGPEFDPIAGAEGWQLSNPPIFQLAALRASMEIFDEVGMEAIRQKGDLLTGYLEFLLQGHEILTPKERGSQLSLRIPGGKSLVETWAKAGVICDFREPDTVRVSPVALYNSFHDVWRVAQTFQGLKK
jgi:kynureninase